MSLSNDDFKMVHIGRGKWNDWHSVGFALENRDQVIYEYSRILISCGQIRCKVCHDHANIYINSTSEYVLKFLSDYSLTDSEVVDLYNRWLYEFHNAANVNSGKNSSSFPTYEAVAEYYLNYEQCTDSCAGH